MLQSTAGWKHSPAELSQVNPHIIIWATFAIIICLAALLVLSSAFFCLKAFWRSYCYVWIVFLRLIPLNLKVSNLKVSFIADKQARQISMPAMSNVNHQALWIHFCQWNHEFISASEFMNSFHFLNSCYNFIKDLIIMNSYAAFHDRWIQTWIHVYEKCVKSFMKSGVPRFQNPDVSLFLFCLQSFKTFILLERAFV